MQPWEVELKPNQNKTNASEARGQGWQRRGNALRVREGLCRHGLTPRRGVFPPELGVFPPELGGFPLGTRGFLGNRRTLGRHDGSRRVRPMVTCVSREGAERQRDLSKATQEVSSCFRVVTFRLPGQFYSGICPTPTCSSSAAARPQALWFQGHRR